MLPLGWLFFFLMGLRSPESGVWPWSVVSCPSGFLRLLGLPRQRRSGRNNTEMAQAAATAPGCRRDRRGGTPRAECGPGAIRKFRTGCSAAGCRWPFVSVRAGACGVCFLSGPPRAGACVSGLAEGLAPRPWEGGSTVRGSCSPRTRSG